MKTDENLIWVEPDKKGALVLNTGDIDVLVPNFGFAVNISDRIIFKGQLARAIISSDVSTIVPTSKSWYIESALSVMF